MKNLRTYLLLVLFTGIILPAQARDKCIFLKEVADTAVRADGIVMASDFGVKPNSFENASPGIEKAIRYCKEKKAATLLLPGERIDLWPEGATKEELYISNCTEGDTLSKLRNIGFSLDGLNNITIEGNNTLVVLHGKMVSFAILNSSNVTVRNISFDYDRPTMSEITIVSVKQGEIETRIHPDSKYYIDGNHRINFYGEGWKTQSFHAILFDPGKETMQYSTFKPFSESDAVATGPFQVTFRGDFSKTNFHPGEVLTLRDPYRDNTGAFINRSKGIRLDKIGMHYMHGLGIVSQFSENISLIKVKVAPAEGSGRIIGAFADCFHFSGCRGSILLDSCLTSGSHDDPVNVHGTHLKITGIGPAGQLTARFMHHQTWGFEAFFAGDSVSFIDPNTLLPAGYAVVKSARLINKHDMELVLKGASNTVAKIGDCIENITWMPELTIRNCRFERTNTRGVLVTTRRKVLIENNTFYRTGMQAILIADDATSWYESGAVRDVVIRNNRFEECGYNLMPGNYIIAIAPENHQLRKDSYVHSNIQIENNFFKVYSAPILTARSVKGLAFVGNTIAQSDFIHGDGSLPVIKLAFCKDVTVSGNRFNTTWKGSLDMEGMGGKEVKSDLVK